MGIIRVSSTLYIFFTTKGTQSISRSITKYPIEKLFKTVLDFAFQIHTALGPGLLDSAYGHCLHFKLINKGLHVRYEKALFLVYKDVKLEAGYRIEIFSGEKGYSRGEVC